MNHSVVASSSNNKVEFVVAIACGGMHVPLGIVPGTLQSLLVRLPDVCFSGDQDDSSWPSLFEKIHRQAAFLQESTPDVCSAEQIRRVSQSSLPGAVLVCGCHDLGLNDSQL